MKKLLWIFAVMHFIGILQAKDDIWTLVSAPDWHIAEREIDNPINPKDIDCFQWGSVLPNPLELQQSKKMLKVLMREK